MRVLVLSDIHSNLEALESALERAEWEQVWVLGDLVGYGANPNEVVGKVRGLQPELIVRGNHDKVCCGLETTESFSELAAQAAEWTRGRLSDESREYLRGLPQGPVSSDGWVLSHGSPLDEDEYLLSDDQVWPQMEKIEEDVCLFGHTHVPFIYLDREGRRQSRHVSESRTLRIEQGVRYFINPGSIGQPRDADPRGCFGILDPVERRFQFVKFPYPIDRAGEKIIKAGLPSLLAQRLYVGR